MEEQEDCITLADLEKLQEQIEYEWSHPMGTKDRPYVLVIPEKYVNAAIEFGLIETDAAANGGVGLWLHPIHGWCQVYKEVPYQVDVSYEPVYESKRFIDPKYPLHPALRRR